MSANPDQAQLNPVQGQVQGQPRPYAHLIRPEELQKATFLDDATRSKYTMAFRQFWNYVEQKPAGSQDHQTALAKLTEWSQKLKSMANQHRMRMQQQQQQAQALKAQQTQTQTQGQQGQSQEQQQVAE